MAEALQKTEKPRPQPNVLVLLGEWFGDAYFPLRDKLDELGWRHRRVGPAAEYRGCYNKSRNVLLRSDILISDIEDFSGYDVLIIPSGPQFRLFLQDESVLHFIRDAHQAGLLITSFCTGNRVIRAAGLLDSPDGIAWNPSKVTKIGERILIGPRGGGPPPGKGFEEAPIDELCAAIAAELGASETPQTSQFWGDLPAGPWQPGFRLTEIHDPTRSYPAAPGEPRTTRPIRVYLWYPAGESDTPALVLDEYVRLAMADYSPAEETSGPAAARPVPLEKGISPQRLADLLLRPTAAVADAPPAPGSFPLLVLGQGLYYESPLSQFVLAEYLAAHGYVVATCPLMGTRYRLVNLNVADLETEIRDLEAVMAHARGLSFVAPGRLGVIGYDLGGMAGLTMTMRQPDVAAFLSLDAGILQPHPSGLPGAHPSFAPDRFTVPWMHITQTRFIQSYRDHPERSASLAERPCGDTYLVGIPTRSHGDFSAYAMLGPEHAVPGYWGPVEADPAPFYTTMCRLAGTFFDACLKEDPLARDELRRDGEGTIRTAGHEIGLEFRAGRPAPPAAAEWIQRIIQNGADSIQPDLDHAIAAAPGGVSIDETVLNWLGYHFLYWWGREAEAVTVFQLAVRLYPDSANAHDSLAEAYLANGFQEKAIASYRRSMELNPQNTNARNQLERLGVPAQNPNR